jgi:chromate reductase
MTILVIPGSLRADSINRSLAQAAVDTAPPGISVRLFDLADLPFYNGDLDNPENWPAEVLAFAEALRNADGVLIATPEYNHLFPGLIGNALDWASRPLGGLAPLKGRPVAVMGASPGLIGTARAQDHLKFALMTIGARVFTSAGLVVGSARSKFENGQLTDPETLRRLGLFMEKFAVSLQAEPQPA